jgi:hypothetical protein
VTQTRETFAGLSTPEIALWYGLIVVSTAIFALGALRLAAKYRRGRGVPGLDRLRARRAARAVATHTTIRRRDPTAGAAHLLVFYGFLVLFAGTMILAFQDDLAGPLAGWHFWQGWFYLGYSLALDLGALALVAGLCVFALRRARRRTPRLDYARPPDSEGR